MKATIHLVIKDWTNWNFWLYLQMDKCFKLVLCWVGLVLVCKVLVGLCCKFLIGFVVDGGVGVVSCWVDFAGVFEFVIDIFMLMLVIDIPYAKIN
jgi:hypothetical protein